MDVILMTERAEPMKPSERLLNRIDATRVLHSILDEHDARLTALESKPATPASEAVAREIVEAIADYLHHELHPTSLDRLTRLVSAILERHAQTKA
jgi:hypothetical protein